MNNDLTLAICLLAFAAFFVGFVFAMIMLSDRVYHSEADAIFKPKGSVPKMDNPPYPPVYFEGIFKYLERTQPFDFKGRGNINTGTPTIPRVQVPPPPKPKKQ